MKSKMNSELPAEEINVMGFLGNQSNRIKISKNISNNITIILDEELTKPSDYRDEVWTIMNAGEEDDTIILCNSMGGSLSTALMFREALLMSASPSTAIIAHECSSAATIIALSCDNVGVLDSAEFMIHTAKFGSGGNTNNVKDHVDFTHKQIHKLIDDVYTGFLTKDEIEKVKLGKEFWFDADETRIRLNNRAKFIEAKHKKSVPKKPTKKDELSSELLLG